MATYQNSTASGRPSGRLAMPAAVVLMLIGIAIPPSSGRYADALGGVIVGLATPLSHPFARLARYLNPARPRAVESEVEAALRNELDLANAQFSALLIERDALLTVIEDLQRARSADWSQSIELFAAPVVGGSSDLSGSIVRVRAGSNQGINVGSVAAATIADPGGADTLGAQLVGRVTQAGPRLCTVRTITDAGAPSFGAYIDTDQGAGLATTLQATGEGTLTGPVEYTDGGIEVREGMAVRLRDESWPGAAQGLAVGRVSAVDTDIDGRQRITVEPALRLRNVARVTFWLDEYTEEAAGNGGGG